MFNSTSHSDFTKDQIDQFVRKYRNRGHLGFMLWYRQCIDASGPDETLLSEVAHAAKNRWSGVLASVAQVAIRALT